jgi:adenosine deaminase
MTPMTDLHRHLEGSIRPTTAYELGMRFGFATADREAWRSQFVAADREGDLLPYLSKIDHASARIRTLEDWNRVTREAIADACDDGLTGLELRFCPTFIATMTGLDPDEVIEAVGDAVAANELPIDVGLIGIILRDQGPAAALSQMARLLRHADRLVGVDLAGNEAGYPASQFADAFELAHHQDIAVTIHAGEAAGPHSVWDAIEHLRPQRIGHGVRSAEDPRLLDHLAAAGITLEVAVTSNVQTGAARGRIQHQLSQLVGAGVPVALCTDNPTVSNTRLSREYDIARDLVGEATLRRIRAQGEAARFL